jgi:hypothetical protein
MKRIVLLPLAAILLASCSTISTGAAQAEALRFLETVDDGEVGAAVAMSSRPFLFESEILVSEALVTDLWTGLSGLDFSSGEISGYGVIDGDSYRYFADSWEVRTWLENYTDETTALVFFNWQNRELVIVVDRNARAKQRIQGFGEVR